MKGGGIVQYWIGEHQENKLVRDVLRGIGVSASLLARLKRDPRGILLNGEHVTVRAVVQAGDLLELAIEDTEPSLHIVPTRLDFEILLETPDFLAVNKPAGMPTHPSHGHFEDTLANALAYYFSERNRPFCPRFINRLDRDTTGVVLVALHALSAASLSRAMAAGEIKKTYLALAHGKITAPTVIDSDIRRAKESIILREACARGEGDFAKTVVEPLASNREVSLLHLKPETGRTHQLRVHLASVGHPLLGDRLYGKQDDGFLRHALHAATLSFGFGGRRYEVKAPLPADMKQRILEMGEEVYALAREKIEKSEGS